MNDKEKLEGEKEKFGAIRTIVSYALQFIVNREDDPEYDEFYEALEALKK